MSSVSLLREGPNTKPQGTAGGFGIGMRQNTRQLAFDWGEVGEAQPDSGEGSPPAPAPDRRVALAQGLMEEVVAGPNLRRALRRVQGNKGSAGIDGMAVQERAEYLKEQWSRLREELLVGTYKPQAVRRVEIPKPEGGMRQLGIPTVVDRFIQQALLQVLSPLYEPTFSPHSYGFRRARVRTRRWRRRRSTWRQGGAGW